MPAPLNLEGQVFGELTALYLVPAPLTGSVRGRWWRCKCSCGTEIDASAGELKNGTRVSCGCANKNTVKDEILPGVFMSLATFEDNLFPDPNSGCLLFAGRSHPQGYGIVYVRTKAGRKSMYAHRVAWLVAKRDLPAKPLELRHMCNTPCCCNVDHLVVGTRHENALDIAIAERYKTGAFPRGVSASGRGYKGIIGNKGYKRYLGTFDTIEEAAEAVRIARAQMFKDRGIKLVYPVP